MGEKDRQDTYPHEFHLYLIYMINDANLGNSGQRDNGIIVLLKTAARIISL